MFPCIFNQEMDNLRARLFIKRQRIFTDYLCINCIIWMTKIADPIDKRTQRVS